jgi:SET domain-containing protein
MERQRKLPKLNLLRPMILPNLFIAPTDRKGLGVFTSEIIVANTIIEIAPVIVMSKEDRIHLDKTLLHDYIFEWGEDSTKCCMALGYVPIYNHACPSNCEYEMDFANGLIQIKTVRDIIPGEELSINYNGNFDDESSVWFPLD